VLCEKCNGKFKKTHIENHIKICSVKTMVVDETEVTIVDKIYNNI
jgi:hypothetical protein